MWRVSLGVAARCRRVWNGCPISSSALKQRAARRGTAPAGSAASPPITKTLVDARLAQLRDDVGQMRVVADEPGREVRRDGVAVAGEPHGQVERGAEALRLGRRDGQRRRPAGRA